MIRKTSKNRIRVRIHRRIRLKVAGTPERPRVCVFRSLKHIYAQVIDDLAGRTLVAASSLQVEVKGDMKTGGNLAAAKVVGKAIAEKAKAAGVTKVAFDRGGRRYHGRVKALADAARQAGLKF